VQRRSAEIDKPQRKTLDTTVENLVNQLNHVGLRPPEWLATRLIERAGAARPALLELATNILALYDKSPRCWGPVHALRLLAEVPSLTIIEPLLNQVPIEVRYEGDQSTEIWASELLSVLAANGPEAIPALWEWADNPAHSSHSRAAAMHALLYIASEHPAVRAELADEALRRLRISRARAAEQTTEPPAEQAAEQTTEPPAEQTTEPPAEQPAGPLSDRTTITFLVFLLAHLQASAAYREVMAAYRAKQVDTAVLPLPASEARQLLLGEPSESQFPESFSLWDRYDIFGPFADDDIPPRP
jgi:hypothetical protein